MKVFISSQYELNEDDIINIKYINITVFIF